jgi:hypothetical protein
MKSHPAIRRIGSNICGMIYGKNGSTTMFKSLGALENHLEIDLREMACDKERVRSIVA